MHYTITEQKTCPPLIGDILAEVFLRRNVRRVGHHHFSEIFVRAARPSSISGSCTTTGMQRLCNFFLLGTSMLLEMVASTHLSFVVDSQSAYAKLSS